MGSGFFALLDDIAALMDDVAVMGKIAGKKTAGILGDDLAVNAEKASGFVSSRELPVLWAITKGSLLNKMIILPIAFVLSAFAPMAISVTLLLGGVYLAYEGAEKIYEYIFPHKDNESKEKSISSSKEDIIEQEKKKIKSAIITDFILSVEIVIIALGTVLGKSLPSQIIVVSIIAFLATIGVYGIVALIVRMDDMGYRLQTINTNTKSFINTLGRILISALPKVIKSLSIIGTIALLLVSGGIFIHNLDFVHHYLPSIPSIISELLIGLIVGVIALFIVKAVSFTIKKIKN